MKQTPPRAKKTLRTVQREAGGRIVEAQRKTQHHVQQFFVHRLERLRASRRWIAGWLLIVAGLIAALAVQSIWFQQSYQEVSAGEGGTYVEATYGAMNTLNPLYASTHSEKAIRSLVFSSLYRYDDTGGLQSDLATSVKMSNDAKTFTVNLRPDIKWHDGKTLDAEDVVFTVELMKDEHINSSLLSTFQSVEAEAIDEQTVKFTLDSPYAMFQHALTFAILPQHILGEADPALMRENQYSYKPIGSGPFQVKLLQNVDSEKDEKVAYLRSYEDYYGGEPKLDRYEVHSYGSRDDIKKALKNSSVNATTDIDIIEGIDPKKHSIDNVPIGNGVFAIFNTKEGVAKSKSVRRALQQATVTADIRQSVGEGVRVMDFPLMNYRNITSDKVNVLKPNLTKAKKELSADGWKASKDGTLRKKKSQKLTLNMVVQETTEHQKAAKILTDQWSKLGVEVKVRTVNPDDSSTHFSRDYLQARNYDVLIYGLSLGTDLDFYPYWHSSQTDTEGLNFANYENDIADEAMVSTRLATDPALRREKGRAFMRQWASDVPAIGLYQQTVPYVRSKAIVSYDYNTSLVSTNDQYGTVVDWHIKKQNVYKTP